MRTIFSVFLIGFCLLITIVFFVNERMRGALLLNLISLFPAGKLVPETPPLLKGGLAPLKAHLEQEFPPGSSARKLEETLRNQGFGAVEERQAYPMIRAAAFMQPGGGLRGPYPMVAVVKWQQDQEGRIVWTEAHIGYRGL